MTKESEPPFFIAVRFARLRERIIGQVDEIEALFDLLTSSERILKMSNDALVKVIKHKTPSPTYIQHTTLDIITDVQDALTRFFDAKITRIQKILEHLEMIERDVSKHRQQLREFESLWENIQEEHARIKYEFMSKPLSKYTVNTIDEFKSFQNLISNKGLPLMRRLKEMEQTLEGEIMSEISIFVKANTVIDSNKLYNLLVDDP